MDNFGFLKVAAAVPHVRVADCDYNTERMAAMAEEAARRGVEIVAFPELGVTAYTCGDLLLQQTLLDAADEALARLVRDTRKLPLTMIAGAPLRHAQTLYNCAVVFTQGRILGVVPKTYIPDYTEFYENRWFASGAGISEETIPGAGQAADFGAGLTFEVNGTEFGVELCEDLWTAVPPSSHMALSGAKVIFNDGGSQQYPGSRQPGLDYNGGIVQWDGSSAALAAVECETTIPVTSVSISGDGVRDGKLALKSGASAQLTATVKPDNATDRKVTWTSSDSSVANVMGTGVVTAGSKAGKATIKATAGGKSASVTVTVTDVPKQPMTVWYKPASSWKTAKVHYKANGKWTGSAQQMTLYRDGWYKYTIPDTAGGQVRMAFTDGGSAWDNNGGQGKDYRVSGGSVAVAGGQMITDVTPNCTIRQ